MALSSEKMTSAHQRFMRAFVCALALHHEGWTNREKIIDTTKNKDRCRLSYVRGYINTPQAAELCRDPTSTGKEGFVYLRMLFERDTNGEYALFTYVLTNLMTMYVESQGNSSAVRIVVSDHDAEELLAAAVTPNERVLAVECAKIFCMNM